MSKETTRRIALEKGYSAVCRRSVISDPAYRENMTLNGQDVAAIYLKVLELGGKSGYMKYRTVPIFPQVGDKINKAIERVATNRQNGAEAMVPGAGGGDRRPQEGRRGNRRIADGYRGAGRAHARPAPDPAPERGPRRAGPCGRTFSMVAPHSMTTSVSATLAACVASVKISDSSTLSP